MYLNGDFGKNPEEVNAYAASAFYAVDRYASFQIDWKADYEGGVPILADRYTTSNMIYQLGKLPRTEWENYLSWAQDFEYDKLGLPRPDLVLFLDMPVEVSQALLLGRYHGDEEKKDIHESDLAFAGLCADCPFCCTTSALACDSLFGEWSSPGEGENPSVSAFRAGRTALTAGNIMKWKGRRSMVYVFLAEGFEEIEALTPVDLMRRAGLEVGLAGVGGLEITGSHGISVKADLLAEEADMAQAEAIVLPGGMPGTLNLEHSSAVQESIDNCVGKGVLVAAICAAPSILGHKGLLQGKKATAFPKFQQELEGAVLSADYVCQDGNILTARGNGCFHTVRPEAGGAAGFQRKVRRA